MLANLRVYEILTIAVRIIYEQRTRPVPTLVA